MNNRIKIIDAKNKEIERLEAENERLEGLIKYMRRPGKSVAAHLKRIAELEAEQLYRQKFVDLQAEDEGLWFIAETATEAYLQRALRGCHQMIEQALGEEHE